MIKLIIPLKAMGAVRMTQRSKFANPSAKRYLNYKSDIRRLVRQKYKTDVLVEPLKMHIDFYFEPPASYSNKKRQQAINGLLLYKKKPDVDNLFKGVTDALNGLIYKDDSLIVSASMTKRYAEENRIDVYLEVIECTTTGAQDVN